MPIELAQISSQQLVRLNPSQTVFFFPVGPLEDHGFHLPLGMDLIESSRLAWLLAEKLEKELPGWVGVLMPPAPLGIEANTSRLVVTVRAHVLRDYLVDSCRSLIRMGFAHFVCLSGHMGPRQLTAIEDAGKIIRRFSIWKNPLISRWRKGKPIPTLISANSALVSVQDVLRSPFWPDPVEHGGKRDTSVALKVIGERVDPSYSNLGKKDSEPSGLSRAFSRINKNVEGYWGSPAEASVSEGEHILKEQVDQIFPKMKMIWEGSPPASLFRSWYSIIPVNQSFFKAWLLLLGIFIFLFGWVYFSLLLWPVAPK